MYGESNCLRLVPFVLVLILLFSCLINVPAVAQGETYYWKDKVGNAHFTDDLSKVPPGMRHKLEIIPEEPRRQSSEVQGTPQTEGSEDMDSGDASDIEAGKDLEEEAGKRQKKLEEDSASLEDLSREINRTHTTWKRHKLQRERLELEEQIKEDQKTLEDTMPDKEP